MRESYIHPTVLCNKVTEVIEQAMSTRLQHYSN